MLIFRKLPFVLIALSLSMLISCTKTETPESQTIRNIVTYGMQKALAIKITLAEYYSANGRWPSSAEFAEIYGPLHDTRNGIRQIDVSGGHILIIFDDRVNPRAEARILIAPNTYSANTEWTCVTRNIAATYLLPIECR